VLGSLGRATQYLHALTERVAVDGATAGGRVVVAYVFPRDRVIDPSEIAAAKLTHVNYAFVDIRDGRVAPGFATEGANLKALGSLRRKHPHLKVLASVGGWTWSGSFSDVALTRGNAPAFRRQCGRSRGPFTTWTASTSTGSTRGCPGYGNSHRPEDRQNFTALMSELRAALDRERTRSGRRYLLTFAAGGFREFLANVEIDKLEPVVDFVNLMAYDLRNAELDPLAGHHANLYTHAADPRRNSADQAVRDFLAAGVLPASSCSAFRSNGRAWGNVASDAAHPHGLYTAGSAPEPPLETCYQHLAANVVDRGGYARFLGRHRVRSLLVERGQPHVDIVRRPAIAAREVPLTSASTSSAGAMFWEYYADTGGTLLDTLFHGLKS
jgi:chitinase